MYVSPRHSLSKAEAVSTGSVTELATQYLDQSDTDDSMTLAHRDRLREAIQRALPHDLALVITDCINRRCSDAWLINIIRSRVVEVPESISPNKAAWYLWYMDGKRYCSRSFFDLFARCIVSDPGALRTKSLLRAIEYLASARPRRDADLKILLVEASTRRSELAGLSPKGTVAFLAMLARNGAGNAQIVASLRDNLVRRPQHFAEYYPQGMWALKAMGYLSRDVLASIVDLSGAVGVRTAGAVAPLLEDVPGAPQRTLETLAEIVLDKGIPRTGELLVVVAALHRSGLRNITRLRERLLEAIAASDQPATLFRIATHRKYLDPVVLDAIASRCLEVPCIRLSDAVGVLRSLASSLCANRPLIARCLAAVDEHGSSLEPNELSGAVYALGQLRVEGEQLSTLLSRIAQQRDQLVGDDLAMALFGLAMVNPKIARQYSTGIWSRQPSDSLTNAGILQAYQTFLAADLPIIGSWRERVQAAHDSLETPSENRFEREVRLVLEELGFFVESQKRIGSYFVDAIITMNGATIALECDGDRFPYLNGDPRRGQCGSDVVRDLLLRRRGISVVHLPASEWARWTDKRTALSRMLNKYTGR